ncbi:helix-turn-helix transcriptional regulator [bacterium]|nr:helix-turn-helix transcriptional regulator [bacterium]
MSTKDERLVLLGQQIKKIRKSKKVSQLNLSIKLGITREHLSKLERGVTYPSVKILFAIVDLLNIKFKDLINF